MTVHCSTLELRSAHIYSIGLCTCELDRLCICNSGHLKINCSFTVQELWQTSAPVLKLLPKYGK